MKHEQPQPDDRPQPTRMTEGARKILNRNIDELFDKWENGVYRRSEERTLEKDPKNNDIDLEKFLLPASKAIDDLQSISFRKLSPEAFWSGSVSFITNCQREEVMAVIADIAREQNFTFSGFLSTSSDGELQFEFTRYPRRFDGKPVAPVTEYEQQLEALEKGLTKRGYEVESILTPPPANEHFRTLLGLEEGYLESEKRELISRLESEEGLSVEEARAEALTLMRKGCSAGAVDSDQLQELSQLDPQALVGLLKRTDLTQTHRVEEAQYGFSGELDVDAVEIFTAGPWGTYREPAVLLQGETGILEKVQQFAAAMHQARFAVEVGKPDGAEAYMVEISPWCEDPDNA